MTENFSSAKFFCRYCEIDRDTFIENPLARGIKRTVTENVNNISIYQETEDLIRSKGIKTDSVFNELKYFHTVWGLPPCLAHDISEGIGAFDLSFILNYYISNCDFTAAYLNISLAKLFKLLPSTSYSSYTFKSKRLSGNGTQNMYFINANYDLIALRIQHILFKINCSNPLFIGHRETYKYMPFLNCYMYESSTDNCLKGIDNLF